MTKNDNDISCAAAWTSSFEVLQDLALYGSVKSPTSSALLFL